MSGRTRAQLVCGQPETRVCATALCALLAGVGRYKLVYRDAPLLYIHGKTRIYIYMVERAFKAGAIPRRGHVRVRSIVIFVNRPAGRAKSARGHEVSMAACNIGTCQRLESAFKSLAPTPITYVSIRDNFFSTRCTRYTNHYIHLSRFEYVYIRVIHSFAICSVCIFFFYYFYLCILK